MYRSKTMEKCCGNCRHWKKIDDEERLNAVAGTCDKEPFDISYMKANEFAICCGHDGPIYFGIEFGCINWKAKE